MPATLGAMTKGFSEILTLPKPEADRYARVLRDAGLLTTGARGSNAPAMTYLDAARLLLAFLVTSHAPSAGEAVVDFGQFICTNIHLTKKAFVLGAEKPFGHRHTLEDGIAEALRIYAEDFDKEYFKEASVSLGEHEYLPVTQLTVRETALNAELSLPGATYFYSDRFIVESVENHAPKIAKEQNPHKLLELMEANPSRKHLELFEKYRRAIRVTREISSGELEKIAMLIA